ncbi:hypothetical protein ACMD2_21160 [Ananas comosus]|uniref:Uncharacterized protein n=1 Tax=Ananas comosus TaxID=4615 RepID=A0A199V924_ANACO|nr:hypothetical protein ACMD2_21160 [Ananas comosus]
MVGYSDPCPCCGNKRRRSTLDRWATWPRPSSAAQHPRPAKFARSASDPTPSAVAAAVKENDILASPVPTDLSSTGPPVSSPGCPNPSPTAAGTTASDPSQPAEAEPTAKVPCPFRCPPAPGITEKKEEEEEAEEEKKKKKKMEAEMIGARRRESEKKEDKEWEMKTKAEIRVPEGVEIKICFKCECGNSEEVILP